MNRVAYWLGGFVGVGRLTRTDVENALTAAALAAGLEPDEPRSNRASPLARTPLYFCRHRAQQSSCYPREVSVIYLLHPWVSSLGNSTDTEAGLLPREITRRTYTGARVR